MRAIKYTNRFKRDYRREQSGVLGKKLDKILMEAVNLLAADKRAFFGRNCFRPPAGHTARRSTPSLVIGRAAGAVAARFKCRRVIFS
jgi:hypothetical protein